MSVFRRLLQLALPVIGLNLLNVLALAVDTAMCGRLPESEVVLTGLGYATQLIFLLMVALMGLLVGTVSLVSRAHGADDRGRVEHLLAQASALTVGVALAVAVVGWFGAAPLMRLLGASGPSVEQGLAYLRPMLLGTVFSYLNILYAGIFRGVGNTRLPFLTGLLSNVLNVVLNYGLILGNYGLPALGAQGAALGTVISQACGLAVMVWLLGSGRIPALRLRLRGFRLDGGLARQLFRVGAPAALDMLILNASFLTVVGMLGTLDELAVGAHGVGLRIQALAFIPGLSVSQATGALVGMALGREDVAEARAVTRASLLLCTGILTSLAGLILLGVDGIIALFDVPPDSALFTLSRTWIRILGLGMPGVGVYLALVGLLRGAGATNAALRINALTVAVQIPLSYVLGFTLGFGVAGVWAGLPLSFLCKAVLGGVVYRRGHWAHVGRLPQQAESPVVAREG